jgi:DNA polymerase
VRWIVGESGAELFGDEGPPSGPVTAFNVPREFVHLAEQVIHHRAEDRFALLYRLLWRLAAEPGLLKTPTDADVIRAEDYRHQVAKAVHKMHAFVRFRQVEGEEAYVAWFEPAHRVVELAAPFFARRFANMRFSILTPERSAHWDGEALTFTEGAQVGDAPTEDALEEVWRTYYASIFNPARLKTQAMKKEMPQRYWRNLPEAKLIPELIRQAGNRTEAMVHAPPTEPTRRIPRGAAPELMQPHQGVAVASVDEVWAAVQGCRRCDLWRDATQGVAGAGPATARLMLVGEQPGDVEDLKGQPFVGSRRAAAGPRAGGSRGRPHPGLRHQLGEALQVRAPRQAAAAQDP